MHNLEPFRIAVIALAALLVSPAAVGQSLLDEQPASPSDGVRLPFTSPALQDDAASLEVNPAGLGFLDTYELGYGFEQTRPSLNEVGDQSQALFLATGGQLGGIGFSAQFLERPRGNVALDRFRKYTFGYGFGIPRTMSFGFNVNWFGSDFDERLDGLVAWDVGWQFRLGRHLGFGFVARDLNAPFLDENQALPRRFGASAALRFFEGRLIVDNSVEWISSMSLWSWTPRLRMEPIDGLSLFSSTSFAIDQRPGGDGLDWDAFWAGVELSFGGVGAAYAAVFDKTSDASPSYTSISGYHWLSPNKQRPLFRFKGRWVRIDLNAATTESALRFAFFSPVSRSFLALIKTLDDIANDETVDGVVLYGGDTDFGFGQAWELRQAIDRLDDAGKSTVAYVSSTNLKEYYIASSADEIWIQPTDPFNPGGVQLRLTSYKGVLNRAGVEAEFIRIGDYKSAPEALVEDEPTQANREQINRLLDIVDSTVLAGAAASRGISVGKLRESIDRAPLYPDEALEAGLVDAVLYPDELDALLRDRYGLLALEDGYSRAPTREERWGHPAEIAVVSIEGNIISGSSGITPFSNTIVTGGQTIQAICDALGRDPGVAAVVIRIDTPGGSANASDQMYRAIRKLASRKPVVATMGNAATSGGYYAAAGADEIFASPMTITGSIGIFNGKFNAGGLLSWLNVNSEKHARGPERSGIFEPWSPAERQRVTQETEYRYSLFLEQIAATRPLDSEELDAIARGRIWAGNDAIDRKLVDRSGGLFEALLRAEELAGLPRRSAVYRLYPSGGEFFSSGPVASTARDIVGFLGLVPEEDAQRARDLSIIKSLLSSAEDQLLLPVLYDSEEALMLPYEALDFE